MRSRVLSTEDGSYVTDLNILEESCIIHSYNSPGKCGHYSHSAKRKVKPDDTKVDDIEYKVEKSYVPHYKLQGKLPQYVTF